MDSQIFTIKSRQYCNGTGGNGRLSPEYRSPRYHMQLFMNSSIHKESLDAFCWGNPTSSGKIVKSYQYPINMI